MSSGEAIFEFVVNASAFAAGPDGGDYSGVTPRRLVSILRAIACSTRPRASAAFVVASAVASGSASGFSSWELTNRLARLSWSISGSWLVTYHHFVIAHFGVAADAEYSTSDAHSR
jgi:hypothetical protein